MATSNRVALDITAAQLQTFLDAIAEASAVLPAAPSLSSEDRQEISTIGTRLQPFDDAVAEVVPQFPQLVPAYLSTPEAVKDRADRLKLGQMMLAVSTLSEKLRDFDILVGADLFEDAGDGVRLITGVGLRERGAAPALDRSPGSR